MQTHIKEQRVYYADTDAIGIVYHANYLRFFEAARAEYLRSRGVTLNSLLDEYEVQFAVVAINIKYQKVARLDDLLTVISRVSHIGKASVHYMQEIYKEGPQDILCTLDVKLAVVDKQMRPVALPEALKRRILDDK